MASIACENKRGQSLYSLLVGRNELCYSSSCFLYGITLQASSIISEVSSTEFSGAYSYRNNSVSGSTQGLYK